MVEGITALEPADIQILLDQPYGSALPISASDSGRVVTALVLRESGDHIAELAGSDAPSAVHIRAAFLGVGGVQIYVTLIRIGDQVGIPVASRTSIPV